jgi:hypothetical protein
MIEQRRLVPPNYRNFPRPWRLPQAGRVLGSLLGWVLGLSLGRKLAPLVNAPAQAWAQRPCERGGSALALSVGAHLGVSDKSAPTGADCSLSGPLQPHTAPLTLSLPGGGADCLPSAWRAL